MPLASDPDHGIIPWTLIVAAISTGIVLVTAIIALVTAVYGRRAWKEAAAATAPLNDTVTNLERLTQLQADAIAAGERLRRIEEVARQIDACGSVLTGILAMDTIEVQAIAEGGNPPMLSTRVDARYLVARSRVLVGLRLLPQGLLTEVARLSDAGTLSAARPRLDAARKEATAVLRTLQEQLAELERPQPSA